MVLKRKTGGFTIIETLIALLIIMLCFSIGGLIISRVLDTDDSPSRTKALLLIKEMRYNSRNTNVQLDNELVRDNIRVKKYANSYESHRNLLKIDYIAFDNDGKELLHMTEIETIK